MSLIFGFDLGTTSIGFAVIDHDPERQAGEIRRMGVRIFPEARDPDSTPLNQKRRQARLRRRQLRRRRERRRVLAGLLCDAGLLPAQGSPEWDEIMKGDPYALREQAFEKEETLSPHQVGRAIYHLAQRRHFKGRDIDEVSGDSDSAARAEEEDADEKEAKSGREETLKELEKEGKTLGAWLAGRGPHKRKRGVHAIRAVVQKEFDQIWMPLLPEDFRESIGDAIFNQRPTFWRLNTLGVCRFVPDAPLCPKGHWLSQQKRMLEKVNNLQLVGGNARPLDEEERDAILERLQTQTSMSWGGVRKALAPLYKMRGELGAEKGLKFNLEEGGERKLLGNFVEARLAKIFGSEWSTHPHKQEIRDAVHGRLWEADYGKIGKERVVILPADKRRANREKAALYFIKALGASETQAEELKGLKFPAGWEPYSVKALQEFLPRLEAGERFGALLNSPDQEAWRDKVFPDRERPTGEILDRLPTPADKEESRRIAKLRNPTVVRTHNELRKVVNNLIGLFGKPDLIRIELTRDVGASKREREEMAKGIRKHQNRRNRAKKDLEDKGIDNPSNSDVEKWMLWEECGQRCPYTGQAIGFEGLFYKGEFEVEHIWPRSISLDDGFRNKTLCCREENRRKGNRIPFDYLGHDDEGWEAVVNRVRGMQASGNRVGMSRGKVKRFLAKSIPEGFAERQLNDTGYAAREAIAFLGRLWPDLGPEAPVKVQAVSGRITAHLRKLWGLNNILSDTGEKTRADHRHHAIDALVVACAHPGITQRLSHYWQTGNEVIAEKPRLLPPWERIRVDAERIVKDIIVSHRVRKKISGQLHKETFYGDTGEKDGEHHLFVSRKKVNELTNREIERIRDEKVREIVQNWVGRHGGDPKKAFPPYPKRGRKGPEIRKVRLLKKQQIDTMASVATGYVDLGNNHHVAIFELPDGDFDFDVVSLLEASQRLSKGKPVVQRERDDQGRFLVSLSLGDTISWPGDEDTKARIVQSIWASGVVVLLNHDDASGESVYRPGANTLAKYGVKKLSVDPIGRVRSAND